MIVSLEEKNLFLDCRYGATKAAIASASDTLHLFTGDPNQGGVELAATGGYAPITITNNGGNWPAAANGEKVGAVQTYTSTGAWSDLATHWALKNTVTGKWGPAGELPDEVLVSVSGTTVAVTPVIYFASYQTAGA